VMFFKDMLGRLDIDMQVIRHGKFKSAIEPFIREDMSEANREQVSMLVNTLWDHMTQNISAARSISTDQLNTIADELLIRSAKDAKEYNLVDDLKYEDEVIALLKERTSTKGDDKLKTIALKKLNKVRATQIADSKIKLNSKNKVAVIFAEGEIVSGQSSNGKMGSETIAKAINKARKDDKVKAIVLRVNSPGGSALASDVMWREVVLAKAEKPVIVSMGGVAASGGYYIACAADKIFAEASTITGSIGVFGLIPNMKGMFNNKLGINIDRVNTNTFSDGLTPFRPLEEKERAALKSMIEDIYGDFTQKVADGRGMTQANVDSIGQGRVWTGINAKEIGLVDEIGGLNDAIAFAVETAALEDYRLDEMPVQEDPFEKMLKEFSSEVKYQILGEDIGKAEHYYRNIKSVISTKGIYTRLPVDIIID
jgi:protease-4